MAELALTGCKKDIDDKKKMLLLLALAASGNLNVVTHLAGPLGGRGNNNGTGPVARFNGPQDVTSDGINLYIADSNNNIIRKVVIATGEVTTLAGDIYNSGSINGTGSAARFYHPAGITSDGINLYVTDTGNHTIRKIVIATREVTTLAGSAGSPGSTDDTGTAAKFDTPYGITTDGTNLYVADTNNHTIRKIVIATSLVSTLAGTAGTGGWFDANGLVAKFYCPRGIIYDNSNLYVADSRNYVIRKIVIGTADVTTFAGKAGNCGYLDSTGTSAYFFEPRSITSDGTNLYVADFYNHAIRKIVIATGLVTTVAGSAGQIGSIDGIGSGAQFYCPQGLALVGANLYVAEYGNCTIRKIIVSSGAVTTFAGSAYAYGSLDGIGTDARFNWPYSIASDGMNLYVADSQNHSIRKIVIATGQVTTLAGSLGSLGSTDGTGPTARFNSPAGIASDGTNLYVADENNHTIRKIVIATGVVTTLAGSAGSSGIDNGIASAARFNFPFGINNDGTNLYIADTENHTIRKIVIATNEVTTLAGSAGSSGSADGTGSAARFNKPRGIANDGANLYIVDGDNHTIRKIVIATAVVTTLAGTAGRAGSIDETGAAARFFYPRGITSDGIFLYVTDLSNHTIRKIVINTGVVTTLAGTSGSAGSNDGTGPAARFSSPYGIVFSGHKLFVTEVGNHCIRKLE